jgi:hypothetical protein
VLGLRTLASFACSDVQRGWTSLNDRPINSPIGILLLDVPRGAHLRSASASGQNPSRYLLYGDVSAKVAQALRDPDVEHFFTRLIQRVAPKSYVQGERPVSDTIRDTASRVCVHSKTLRSRGRRGEGRYQIEEAEAGSLRERGKLLSQALLVPAFPAFGTGEPS